MIQILYQITITADEAKRRDWNVLAEKSRKYRKEILDLVYKSKKGHIGGCYSCIVFINVLYNTYILNYRVDEPLWNDRDRFLLSKGHSVLALYVVLADVGFLTKEELRAFGDNGSFLGAHPDFRIKGVEISSGSLGNGLGIATGMALADVLDKKDKKTVVLTGDGELYEGAIWEAAMYAAQLNLRNLIWVIDRNRQCVLDFTENCNRLEPLANRLENFGWEVWEVDGHDLQEVENVFKRAKDCKNRRPLVVVANTIKGKGVSFMEKKLEWHHKALTEEEYRLACAELEGEVYGT